LPTGLSRFLHALNDHYHRKAYEKVFWRLLQDTCYREHAIRVVDANKAFEINQNGEQPVDVVARWYKGLCELANAQSTLQTNALTILAARVSARD